MAEQIKIVYRSLDGSDHEAFVWPLKRKEGVKVMHSLISAIGGAAIGGNLAQALKEIDFDMLLSISSPLLRYAVIDGVEFKDLDTFDGFNGRFSDFYVLVFKALEVNYPDFFSLLNGGGLAASIGVVTPIS
jgi:hypothetical protein